MPVPTFDEGTRAEKLPQEVFRWLKEAAMYARSTPDSAEEVYDMLKLLLRLLAVRNPDSQSHATRQALGSVIESIYLQPNCDKILLDLLALLIRMVDAKQSHRFNPMKHLAISGLGYLAKYLSIHMRQMSANVFIISLESLKISPPQEETHRYRNSILWTMTQAAATTVDEVSLKSAFKAAKSMIENGSSADEVDVTTTTRAFNLLAALAPLPAARSLEKKMDSLQNLFINYGISSSSPEIRAAAADFYCAVIVSLSPHDLRYHLTAIVNALLKIQGSKQFGVECVAGYRYDGYSLLLERVLQKDDVLEDFETQFEEWLAPLVLRLTPTLSKQLLVDGVLRRRLAGSKAGVDIVAVLLRQLALSRAPASQRSQSSKSKSSSTISPSTESTLACLTDAITIMGNAVQPSAPAVHQAALGLILNGKDALTDEQLSWNILCLRAIVRNSQPLLVATISMCLRQLEIPSPDSRRVEIAYVIGAMVAESKGLDYYGDFELNSRVVLLAIDNIKRRADTVTYKMGWVLLCGTFCLGAEVVKPLVPQLLLLWETHLSPEACKYPDLVEMALTGLTVFLIHNKGLLTVDVTSRVGKVLYELWSTMESVVPNAYIRRRLLKCYEQLLQVGRLDEYPSSLLMKFVAHISMADNYKKEIGVVIESAINFPSNKTKSKNQENASASKKSTELVLQTFNAIESGIVSTELDSRASLANDIDLVIYSISEYHVSDKWVFSMPRDVYTEVVDLAVSVTSKLLPLQPQRIQESVFDAILTNLENAAGSQSLRSIAVVFNVATFVEETLLSGFSLEDRILNVILSIIKILLGNASERIRETAAKSCGILARNFRRDVNGSAALASLIKDILEFSVSAKCSINLRAGSILAIGYIAQARSEYSLLEAAYKVFMQLAADPNPHIHTPVITSMRRSLMTAEFVDLKYVKCTLKTITLTYLLESHNNSLRFQREVAESLVQVVSRIGPMLSTEQQKPNLNMILCFDDQLQISSDAKIRVLAWKCFIEIYYYARQGIAWPLLIRKWRDIIVDTQSCDAEVDAAINGILMLMKLSAPTIIAIAGNGFEDALWLLLDRKPEHYELRDLFFNWLHQTADNDAAVIGWIRTLSTVVMKPRYFFMNRLNNAIQKSSSQRSQNLEKKASVNPTAVAADEDVALEVETDDPSNEHFSWEARNFALGMLLHLLRSKLRGKDSDAKASSPITSMIGDVIKIAFSSSTSQILGLQVTGLILLNEIIVELSDLTDPDFPQISLLAQYQVQVISAISPAFGSDSSPELALTALQTCSTFITSNIVKTKEKLSRLIKILEDSLVAMESNQFKLGNLETSADAARVLHIAILSVWAEIWNHSKVNPHLQEIVAPHKTLLTELWINTIYEFGRQNSMAHSQWTSTTLESAVEQMKDIQITSSVGPIFRSTWLSFTRALSTLDDQDAGFRLVLCGLCFHSLLELLKLANGPHATNADKSAAQGIPAAGTSSFHRTDALNLSEESLAPTTRTLHPTSKLERERNTEISGPFTKLSVLHALQDILTPSTCERIMESSADYFDEMIPILYRAMLVGRADEQVAVLDIAHALVTGQPETDDSVDHFFEILKIAILPLRRMFPRLFDQNLGRPQDVHAKLDGDQVALLRHTIDTVIDIAQVFREVIQNDLWVCLLKVFEELNHYEPVVVAPSFKRLLEILAAQVEVRGVTFVVGALTISLKRAVNKESISESLLTSTAITCTNSRSLYSPVALSYVQSFGSRAADALLRGLTDGATDEERSNATTAIQCITAILRVCSDAPTGGAFAYGCLPALIKVVTDPGFGQDEFDGNLVKQSASALSLYAALDGTLESFAVVIPALVAVAVRGINVRPLLLQLVTKQPATFKRTVWRMEENDRDLLQSLLAQPAEPDASTASVSDEETDDENGNEIALKSFA